MVSSILKNRRMTGEEFLRLPPEPEGVTRELWEGVIHEFGEPISEGGTEVTTRNRWHGTVEARIGQLLLNWLDNQPDFKGVVASGEVRCRLLREPDTVVGIDVALFGPEHLHNVDGHWFDGPPLLAVEVLSPSDTQKQIHEKLNSYMAAGVAQVWHVDVQQKTVAVHRPGDRLSVFGMGEFIVADPQLPGFKAKVSDVFRIG